MKHPAGSLAQHWFQLPKTKVKHLGSIANAVVAKPQPINPTTCRAFSTATVDAFGMDESRSTFSWRSLLSAKEMQRSDIEYAIQVATEVGRLSRAAGPWRKDGPPRQLDILQGRVLANLFFEPSTRTASSFETAMLRMGGTCLNLNTATSSSKKGETLSDTVQVMAQYADVLAMRHPSADVYRELDPAIVDATPIINAGNGAEEHPTQALLDLLCMKTELGGLDGLNVTLVGDLKHGRTVHSLGVMLSRFDNVTLNVVSPPELRMPVEWLAAIHTAASPSVRVNQLDNFKEVIDQTDVLYMTRVQQERFETQAAYDAVKDSFVLRAEDLLMSRAIVLHPLPRVNEIEPSVDALPNAKYFDQVGYGCIMRSALLGLACGVV